MLIRLDQQPFFELVDERNHLTQAVLRSVVGQLRNRLRDVAVLSEQVRAHDQQHAQPGGSD